MQHPGYLRNFESTLRQLLMRGHHIHLGFDRLKAQLEGQRELLDDLVSCGDCETDFVPQARKLRTWPYYGRRVRFLVDWLRYLDPPFQDAPKLRARLEVGVPRSLKALVRLPLLRSAAGRGFLRRMFVAIDRSIPPRRAIVAYIGEHRPDLVLLTPLLEMNEIQAEYLRAARRMGVPCGYLVASWDNLTSKGVLHDVPDFMTVWNEAQEREAIELHGVPRERVVVTGACAYDHWFDWGPTTSREEFCARVGLEPDRPFLLYVGSSTFIAPHEGPHVESWIDRIRDLGLRHASILVRPHPTNPLYATSDLRSAPSSVYNRPDVSVWPPEGANPTDEHSRSDYYDSIHHSAAVVGINTSALVESAIIGRGVFTLLDEEFRETQEGTLHFAHIASPDSGVLTLADSVEEHVIQLSGALNGGHDACERASRFVETFVRPFGVDQPGTPRMVAAIESGVARYPREPDRGPWYGILIRCVLRVYRTIARLGAKKRVREPRKRIDKRKRRKRERIDKRTTVRLGARRQAQRARPEPRHNFDKPELRKMRIAFVVQYPGYLRYFDSVLQELAGRGHDVQLYFAQPGKQAEALTAFDPTKEGITMGGSLPERKDAWQFFLPPIRWMNGYVRYLDPAFRHATYLRGRARTRLPTVVAPLGWIQTLPRPLVRALLTGLLALERAAPLSKSFEAFLAESAPDVLVVSPFVMIASRQADLVRAARAHGIPTVVAIASWDHLTTKGLARPGPDVFVVWNETQVEEAMTLHRIPRSKIVVTGAQPFDRWFDRMPSSAREAFCEKVGLPTDGDFVLFTGSTASISAPEAERTFVREWVTALREADDPVLRNLGVLIRPHPYNSDGWRGMDISDLGRAAIWPRDGANPVDERDRAEYFDSIYHAAAVVGVNTSAMIEAAVIGRPVLTIEAAEFSETQGGTLHYSYLLPESGGFTRVARSFREHRDQLGVVLRTPEVTERERARFVQTFVRPRGLEVPATPLVVEAIERAADASTGAYDPERWYYALLRAALLPVVVIAARRGRTRQREKAERRARIQARS